MSRQMLTSSCSWSSVTLAELLSWTKSVKRWHKLLNSWHDHRTGPIALASLSSVRLGPGCMCGFAVSRTRLKTPSVYRESGAPILPLVSSPPWAHRIEARHRVSQGSQYFIAHKQKTFSTTYSTATKSQNSIPLHRNHRLLLFHSSLHQNMTVSNETSLFAHNQKKGEKGNQLDYKSSRFLTFLTRCNRIESRDCVERKKTKHAKTHPLSRRRKETHHPCDWLAHGLDLHNSSASAKYNTGEAIIWVLGGSSSNRVAHEPCCDRIVRFTYHFHNRVWGARDFFCLFVFPCVCKCLLLRGGWEEAGEGERENARESERERERACGARWRSRRCNRPPRSKELRPTRILKALALRYALSLSLSLSLVFISCWTGRIGGWYAGFKIAWR